MGGRLHSLLAAFALLFSGGCAQEPSAPAQPRPLPPPELAAQANRQFLAQKTFEPWTLSTEDPGRLLDPYLSNGRLGYLIGPDGRARQVCEAGARPHHALTCRRESGDAPKVDRAAGTYRQSLDIRTGTVTTTFVVGGRRTTRIARLRAGEELRIEEGPNASGVPEAETLPFWRGRDVEIEGEAEAQQVTRTNLFYLLSSVSPNSDRSIPPMGLSSSVYGGRIFWDADVWMFPALIVQYPEYAQSIVNFRFWTLAQARHNAQRNGYAGAEYAWESLSTGVEAAPGEFARERHVTAGVAFAAWQYYLWTGDRDYLRRRGWPVLAATAQYWTSRVVKGDDGKYHIRQILSPDETAGIVDDDAYTNAAARYNLRAAAMAARWLGLPADPRWNAVAAALYIPFDRERGIPAAYEGASQKKRYRAKQASTLLLLHPLNEAYDAATAARMLEFYAAHTTPFGPAMTASVHCIIAARLGHGAQALNYFREAYRPFMRAPWNAFAEKRTTNAVYFLTGMAGCLQSIYYGFAGLQVRLAGERPVGVRVAGDGEVSLYASPRLPPGWSRITLRGVRFRGQVFDLILTAEDRVEKRDGGMVRREER